MTTFALLTALGLAAPPIDPPRVRLPINAAAVHAVAVSADGTRVAGGLHDGRTRVWTLADPAAKPLDLPAAKPGDWVRTVAFSPDGQRLLTGGLDNAVRLWAADGKLVRVLNDPKAYSADDIHLAAFGPDGRTIVTANYSGVIETFETESGKRLSSAIVGLYLTAAVLFPDGRRVAWGEQLDPDRRRPLIAVNDLPADKTRVRRFAHETTVRAVAVSPDGKLLAVGGESEEVVLYDVATAAVIARWGRLSSDVHGLAFSPDGKKLAAAGADLWLWSVADRKPAGIVRVGRPGLIAVRFTPDGKSLVAGGYRDHVGVWDVPAGN